MSLKTLTKTAGATAVAILLASTVPAYAQTATTFSRIDTVMDWGTATTKLIIDLKAETSAASIDKDSFTVSVIRRDARKEDPIVAEGQMALTNAYLSDADGKPVETGGFVTLVPEIGPDNTLSNALNYASDPAAGRGLNAWTENAYTITQVKPIGAVDGLVATEMSSYARPQIDVFSTGASEFDDPEYGHIELTYALFAPEPDDKTNPLVIWLHGGGEGGTDPTIPLAANKSVVFASSEIQAYFGGAYVLVPQAPTAWAHGPAGLEGVKDKADALSIYTRAAQAQIESIVASQPDIDTSRIYVGGLSNGAWMTVRLLIDNPDYYAAGLSVAEFVNLDTVTDEDLAAIANVPLWLVTAGTDTTVPTEMFPSPLYNRLIRLGAKDVHLSYLPRVIDSTGDYNNEDGSPHEYPGHWTWIPTYNNELAIIDGDAGYLFGPLAHDVESVGGHDVVTVMEWWASKSR